jgi:hypothetical protein
MAGGKLTGLLPCGYREPHKTKQGKGMLETLRTFGEWLATTSMSLTIQNVTWIIPLVQTIHILCVAAVFSSVLMVDLRLLGLVQRAQPLPSVTNRFLSWIWVFLVILLVTGSILIIGEPERSLLNPAFAVKMGMLVTVILITLLIARPLRSNERFWEASGGRLAAGKAIAVVSLALWSLIIFAGRWIAYVTSL